MKGSTPTMTTLVIATNNAHKVDEIRAILGDTLEYRTLRDLPQAPTADETGATFAENARIKSHGIARWLLANPRFHSDLLTTAKTSPPDAAYPSSALGRSPVWVLADDSGLEVDALAGAPGVKSARFAADELQLGSGNAPDAANNAKLLRLLADVPAARRTGRFRCALALTAVGDALDTFDFDGACEGTLGLAPRGPHGFGYDPLFVPDGFQETFAELGDAQKNALSHRGQALGRLSAWLRR